VSFVVIHDWFLRFSAGRRHHRRDLHGHRREDHRVHDHHRRLCTTAAGRPPPPRPPRSRNGGRSLVPPCGGADGAPSRLKLGSSSGNLRAFESQGRCSSWCADTFSASLTCCFTTAPSLPPSSGSGAPPIFARCSFKSLCARGECGCLRRPELSPGPDRLLQLVADIFNSVLGDFADMQQAIGAGMISTNAPNSARRVTVPR